MSIWGQAVLVAYAAGATLALAGAWWIAYARGREIEQLWRKLQLRRAVWHVRATTERAQDREQP